MHIILFIVFIGLFTSNTYAGTIDPNTPDNKYVEYAEDFHYIGKINGVYGDQTLFAGSAVAIAKNVAITAAHVVDNAKLAFMVLNDKTYKINKIVIHKDFSTKVFGIADIAVCFIDGDFCLTFYPDLYTDKDEIGKICSMSGYGFTGTFLTGSKFHDNKRRAGSNFIDSIDKHLLICSPSNSKDKSKTSLEFLIASGDSGGGLFIGNKLAGIHSCIISINRTTPNSGYNSTSGHTRISEYADWIRMVVEEE